MNALNILTLNEDNNLETKTITPPGPVVEVVALKGVDTAKLPVEVRAIFDTAVLKGQLVELVACRKIGVPERQDGSHQKHYLVPPGTKVRPVGVTI